MSKKHFPIIFYTISVLPFLFYFFKLPFSPMRDWNYFNSLGMLIGESLAHLKMPLLDPWVCGGLDILSNPQNWIYSPFSILNIFFHPYLANLFSLLICAVFGFWGMLKLCEKMDESAEKYIIAALFNLSPFFFLHFAEGHIAYRTFYFLPLILFFSLNLNTILKLWWLLLILMIMFLDGGIYPFYYSIFLLLLNLNYAGLKKIFLDKTQRKNLAILFFSILFLAFSKIIPVLFIHQARLPVSEQIHYSLPNIIQAFFDIRQSNYLSMEGQKYFFHEYGHYLGLGLTALFVSLLPNMKSSLRLFFQLILFIWIALGFGGDFNPWMVIKSLPFINQIHVQSRFLILFFLIFLSLIIKAYKPTRGRRWLLRLALVELLVCAFFASFNAFNFSINLKEFKLATSSKPLKNYDYYIAKPFVYNSQKISYQCYEPANPTRLKPSSKFFLNTKDDLQAIISNQTIRIISNNPIHENFVINHNWNGGWDCLSGCETFSNTGLIQINPKNASEIIIKYNPIYWQISLACFSIGLFFIILVRRKIPDDF